MNEPHDPNRTIGVPSAPPDSLDAGLAAGFGRAADGPSSVLARLRDSLGDLRPVLLKEAEGESAHVVQPKSDAMPPPEQTGNRYQLQGEIARGGMGVVLRGRDVDLGRDLAVKVLLEKHAHRPDVARRFVEEAQIGGQLQHPGVVPVYDIGRFGERPFFTMKLVKGHTLAHLLAGRTDLAYDRPRFLGIALQVAQTLAYAHAKGVIHRDLKPANVMVGAFGEVQVMDWGLAKVLAEGGIADEERASRAQQEPQDATRIRTARSTGTAGSIGTETEAGSLLGTPAYMPPEQANGDIALLDRRTDVFGLGALLCEILTGKAPYVGRSYEEVRRKAANGDLADALARVDDCGADQELIALARICLSPEAIDRPRDAQAVADSLTAHLNGVQERAQAAERERAVAVARAVEERRRRRVQLALAASVLAFLTLGGLSTAYYFQQQADRERRQAQQQAEHDRQEAERERQKIEQAAAVDRVVSHVVTLRDQAVAHPEDLSRWQVALAAAEQAEVGDDATARDRVQELRTEIQAGREATERDRALLDRLVEIRSTKFDKPVEATYAAYAAAFREAGIDMTKLTPADAGAKIKARPPSVARGMTAALDDWAAILRGRPFFKIMPAPTPKNKADAAQLSEAANVADSDPWRNGMRTALDQADLATRLKTLQDLQKKANFDELGPVSLQLLGTSLSDAGDHKLAESVLRKAQRRFPGDVWVNYELGNVLWKLKRSDEAIRFLTAARAIRPDTAETLGQALEWRGDTDEAITIYCDLLALHPGTGTQLLLRLVGALEGRARSPEVGAALEPAVAAYREAVRLKPDDRIGFNDLAVALRLQGKFGEAIAALRAAKRLEPNEPLHWGRLRTIDPNGGGLSLGGFFVLSGTPDELISAVSFENGNALKGQGKLDEAIAAYREAIKVRPSFLEGYAALVDALKVQGKLDKVTAEYREATRLNPDDAVASFNLGGLLQAQGDFVGALAQYLKGSGELGKKQPGWNSYGTSPLWPIADVFLSCGNGLRDRRQLDEAIVAYKKAIQLKPGYGDNAYPDLLLALKARGKLDETVAAYREAIRLKPENTENYYQLGGLLQAQRDFAGALALYRKAQERDGNDSGRKVVAILRISEAERDAASAERNAAQTWQTPAARGNWSAAAASCARHFAGQAIYDGEHGFEYAAVLLLSGDREGYRKICAELLKRSGQPGVRPYHVARACTLGADSVKDPTLPAKTAEEELRQNKQAFWSLTELGALAYRSGRYDDAATLLEQSLKADDKPARAVLNWFWLAMVEHRRGKPAEARGWLEKAVKWLRQYPKGIPAEPDDTTGWHLHNWLEAQVLRREAEALLVPKK
jgi:serine/threonine-protein kinase